MSICLNSVKMGNLKLLKWACNNECDWNWDVCNEAIVQNYWHIVEWATKYGCK